MTKITIATNTERDIWVSMFNAAVRGLSTAPHADAGVVSCKATAIADQGLFELVHRRIIQGSKADDFSKQES